MYAAPAALFDPIAADRAEQWAVDKWPEYTFWLQADDDLDDETLKDDAKSRHMNKR